MTDLDKRLKQLRSAEKKGDLDRLDRVRQKIIDEHGDAPEAVEARYKLGLAMLLRHGNLEQAEPLFLEAAQSSDPLYSPMARTSYALLLHARKRDQKALFELRKIVSSRKPTPQSAVALAFIVQILQDTGAKPDDVERARQQQIQQLQTLLEQTEVDATRAQLTLQLGLAQVDHGDKAAARETLAEVLSLDADDAAVATAKSALAAL